MATRRTESLFMPFLSRIEQPATAVRPAAPAEGISIAPALATAAAVIIHALPAPCPASRPQTRAAFQSLRSVNSVEASVICD
jgi:hypothetical protein